MIIYLKQAAEADFRSGECETEKARTVQELLEVVWHWCDGLHEHSDTLDGQRNEEDPHSEGINALVRISNESHRFVDTVLRVKTL